VRVTREPQRHAGFFYQQEPMGRVGEQDAGSILIDGGLRKNRAKASRLGRITVIHANDLQAVNDYLVIIEYSNA